MMSKRLSVLFLRHPAGERMFRPWGEDAVACLRNRHDVRMFDPQKPLEPQFKNVDVVLEIGGVAGTREMADVCRGKVRLWQILGQGMDAFDVAYWREMGIPVANCPGFCSGGALADCATMLILMLLRRYPEARAGLDAGVMYSPCGNDPEALRLGIIGFGVSGRELALRARAFGMVISAVDVLPYSDEDIRRFGLDFAGNEHDLDRVVAESDVLSVHLHLTPQTRHIIDKRRLRLMKPTALLINVARGELVDEAALLVALQEGWIGGAGLDAYSEEPPDMNSPLFQMPNVVTTPHIAGVTRGTSKRRAAVAAENVDRVAAGLEPLYRVV
jgi:phosphoglycerate dehydrogenase-like enzyme